MQQAVCIRRRKSKKKNTKKSHPADNPPRKPHQPGYRDHLETDRDETCPTRSPTLARFHRSRVCGNRPRTALAIGKNDECYTHTDRLIKQWHPVRTSVRRGFLPKGKKLPRSLRYLGLASLKTTNVTHTQTDRQIDYLNNGTLYAPRY